MIRAALRKEDSLGIESAIREEASRVVIDVTRRDDAGRLLAEVKWNANAIDEAGGQRAVSVEETGVGKYRFAVSHNGTQRLTIRLHDADEGKVKTLRWNRAYPLEYRLAAASDPALGKAMSFDAKRIREGIPPIRIRTAALPYVVMVALALMLAGGLLRRI